MISHENVQIFHNLYLLLEEVVIAQYHISTIGYINHFQERKIELQGNKNLIGSVIIEKENKEIKKITTTKSV